MIKMVAFTPARWFRKLDKQKEILIKLLSMFLFINVFFEQ